MNARIAVLVIGALAALGVRLFGSRRSGLTCTGKNETRYIPFNIVLFWLCIVATLVVCAWRPF